MTRLRRLRPTFAHRVLVLALFALSLVMQPVLASMADLHALAHDPGREHAHVDHAGSAHTDESRHASVHPILSSTQHAGEEGEETPAGSLHRLMHVAVHCCGHFATAASPALVAAPMGFPAVRPLQPEPQPIPSARRLAPFRPPITA